MYSKFRSPNFWGFFFHKKLNVMKKTLGLILLCFICATAIAQNALWGTSFRPYDSFRLGRDAPQSINDTAVVYHYGLPPNYAITDIKICADILYAVVGTFGTTEVVATDTTGNLLGSLWIPYEPGSLTIFPGGEYATLMVEDQSTLVTYMLDLRNPAAMDTVTRLSYGGATIVSDVAMFMSVYGVGLISFDVADPAVPVPLDTFFSVAGLVNVRDLDIEGNLLFTADYSSKAVGVFDVSDPSNIQLVNQLQHIGVFATLISLDVEDTLLYTVTRGDAPGSPAEGSIVSKINVSNPSGPLALIDTLSDPAFYDARQIEADAQGRIFLSASGYYGDTITYIGDRSISYLKASGGPIQLSDTVIISNPGSWDPANGPIALDDTTCRVTSAGFYAMTSGNTVQVIHQPTAPATHWMWYFGDGDSSNILNPSHTYQQLGTYTICLYAYDDCSPVVKDSCIQVYVGVSGLVPSGLEYTIFPNPSSDIFQIRSSQNLSGHVSGVVCNSLGKDVARFEGSIIDLSRESSGVYWASFTSDDGVTHRVKLLKQ